MDSRSPTSKPYRRRLSSWLLSELPHKKLLLLVVDSRCQSPCVALQGALIGLYQIADEHSVMMMVMVSYPCNDHLTCCHNLHLMLLQYVSHLGISLLDRLASFPSPPQKLYLWASWWGRLILNSSVVLWGGKIKVGGAHGAT